MQIASTTLTFADDLVPKGTRLVGYKALACALKVQAPVRSLYCVSHDYVRGSVRKDGKWSVYDKRYWPGMALDDHLTFALKHEPLDLLVLKRSARSLIQTCGRAARNVDGRVIMYGDKITRSMHACLDETERRR